MSAPDAHPSRDELLAMAYVDDELAGEERARFEARLPDEPALARRVAEYRRIEVLARQVAPPEPADHEWRRLAQEPARRAGVGLGLGLVVCGTALVVGWSLVELFASDAPLPVQVGVPALVAGFAILLVSRLRDRLRTRPYDPYTEVQR